MSNDRDPKSGRIAQRLIDFPSLPKVVEKLLALSNATASTAQFAELIAVDQGLSAKVLKLVNSAFYSLRAPISSIRQASSLLGVRTLKSLALSVSVMQMFKKRVPEFEPLRFWRHGLAVALVGRKIAEKLRLPFQDDVYIAGLLHDIGVAVLATHHPQEFARTARPGSEGTAEGLALETLELGDTHPEVGFQMASHWRLSALVAQGLRHHHTPLSDLPGDLEPDARRLVEVVQLADGYARRSSYSFGEADRLDPLAPLVPAEGLGLQPEGLAELLGDLDKAVLEMEQLYLEGAAHGGRP